MAEWINIFAIMVIGVLTIGVLTLVGAIVLHYSDQTQTTSTFEEKVIAGLVSLGYLGLCLMALMAVGGFTNYILGSPIPVTN